VAAVDILYPVKRAAEWVNGKMLTILGRLTTLLTTTADNPADNRDGKNKRPGRPILDNVS
jgi:hypothetical protein